MAVKIRHADTWVDCVASRVEPVPVESHLVMDGQSFANTPVGATTFSKVVALLPAEWWPSSYNAAVNGTTYAQRKTGGANSAATRLDPHLSGTYQNVIVDIAGQSDLINTAGGGANLTAATLLAQVEAYIAERRAAGADVYVACTVPPNYLTTGGQETERLAYNALLLASGAPDAVADIAALPHAQDHSDATYYSDQLHPTSALADEFASTIEAAVDTLAYRFGLMVT